MKTPWQIIPLCILLILCGCALKNPARMERSAQARSLVFVPNPLDENAYYGANGVWLGSRFDNLAELPRVGFHTDLWMTPSPGKIITVPAGADAVVAMNSANCGDTIQLEAGASFTVAPVALIAKNCDILHWIGVTSSFAPGHWKLPYAHRRINPSYAGVAALPGRAAFSGGRGVNSMAKLVITGNSGFVFGDHFRVTGLEITRPSDGKSHEVLIHVDNPYLILDRNWIHGDAVAETTHLVQLGSGADHFAAIDNYMNDAHCTAVTGSCTDAQDISGGDGGKVIKIVNNFLEASGENILFGGKAASSLTGDVEIRLNHLFKPMIWNPADPSFFGTTFITKNHFELKEGERFLVEDNLLENVWGGFSQKGGSILLSPKNQAGANGTNLCPICEVHDVTIRYNESRHGSQAMQIANAISDNKGWALGGSRYSIHDLIFDDFQFLSCYSDCAGNTLNLASGYVSTNPPPSVMSSVTVDHVTFITSHPPTVTFLSMGGPPSGNVTLTPQMSGIKLTNSIFETGINGAYPTGGGADDCAVAPKTVADKIAACWLGDSLFAGNVIVTKALKVATVWPLGNQLAADWNAIGFVNFNGGNGGDYHLTGPFRNSGTDGRDPGANVDAVMSVINVIQ